MAMPTTLTDDASTEAAIQSANARLADLRKGMELITDRMSRVLSRAFGEPSADAAKTTQPRALPSGALGLMEEQIAELSSIVSEQSGLLSRLDRIV